MYKSVVSNIVQMNSIQVYLQKKSTVYECRKYVLTCYFLSQAEGMDILSAKKIQNCQSG
jgi:hypothetical protein